jgi:membrane protein involved in colicin uptake
MSGSLLDMLRQRTTGNMQDEALRRASEFGAGMLASGSPNFFAMLGAGARAQAEGERSRTDELRRLADIERQQRALDIEEARRQEELRIRAEEQAANAPLRAAQTQYYLSRAEADPTGIATTRAENAARNAASAAAERAVQAEATRRSRAVPPLPALTESEATTIRNNTFLQGLRERGFAPPAGAAAPAVATPAAPAAVIDARGNVVNPPR